MKFAADRPRWQSTQSGRARAESPCRCNPAVADALEAVHQPAVADTLPQCRRARLSDVQYRHFRDAGISTTSDVQLRLDRANGCADVTAGQATRPERTGAVLAQGGERGDGTGDGAGHRCYLAARLGSCHGMVIAACGQGRCLRGVPGRAERVCSHVGDGGCLLGGVGRRGGRRSWCLPSGGTCLCTSTSHGLVDMEFARSKGASLFDRGSHSRVVRDGVLEDDENVLGTVGRPRRDDAAIFNAQRLRGECDQMSVGRR